MTATVEYTTDLGDTRVQVFSRTDSGHPFSIVIMRHLLNTATMYQVLAARAATVDKEADAIAAHQARGVT